MPSPLTAELLIAVVMTVDDPVTDLPLEELGVEPVGAGAHELVTAVGAVPQQVAARQAGHTLAGDAAELITGAAGRRRSQTLL